MATVLTFAVTLLVAVLLSGYASRTVLSTSVLFLVVGFALGPGVGEVIEAGPGGEAVKLFSELALFAVLFTDGMRVGLQELRSGWRLPGRALFIGLPLTLLLTALLARWLGGLGWTEALLVGAALAPTDPVLAAAIVGREEVPARLRHLLNVESGLNDGLALPIVIALLPRGAPEAVGPGLLAAEVALGVGLGIGLPWLVVRLEQGRILGAAEEFRPLLAFSLGLVLLMVTRLTHANEFLAAFAGGVTIATIGPDVREAFERFGGLVAELLKLGALLLFGAVMSPELLGSVGAGGWAFAALALLAVRPLALAVALPFARRRLKEWIAAAWFGPKGFASVTYGLLILGSGSPQAGHAFHLVAIVVALSIVLHSSTDVLVARWFRAAAPEAAEEPARGETPA